MQNDNAINSTQKWNNTFLKIIKDSIKISLKVVLFGERVGSGSTGILVVPKIWNWNIVML